MLGSRIFSSESDSSVKVPVPSSTIVSSSKLSPSTGKYAYFPVDGESLEEETIVEEGTGTLTEESDSEEKILDPNMNVYSSAISKLKPLG